MQFLKKLLFSTTCAAILASALMLLACEPEVSDQQTVQTAREYFDQNKLREASLELKNALQKNPNNAEARYLLGIIYLKIGDAASAEKEFRRAAGSGWQEGQARVGQARAMVNSQMFQKLIDEINVKESYPVNTRANLFALRALAQLGLGNASQARETLDKALGIDANAFHVLTASVQIHLANNELELATNSLLLALRTYQINQEILLLSAALAIKKKDFTEAARAYKKVIAKDPDKLITMHGRRARLALARFHISNKAFDLADKTLIPLLTHMPNDPETSFVTGLLAFERGNLDLAEERLLTVLKEVMNHPPTQLLFGTVSYAQHNYEQATYYIAKYVSVMPENLTARKLLGRSYIKLGRHEDAQALLQSGLEVGSEDAELLALISLSQMQTGDAAMLENDYLAAKHNYEQALQHKPLAELAIKLSLASARAGKSEAAVKSLLAWLDDHPDDARVLQFLGTLYQNMKQNDEAIKAYEKVLMIQPDNVVSLNNLAGLYSLANNPKALELAKSAHRLNSNNAGIKDTYGWLLVQHAQAEKGLRLLEQAKEELPGSAEIQYHYAVALLKLGEEKSARSLLKKLLDGGEAFEGRDVALQLLN